MLMVISPAKTLDFETPAITGRSTAPEFIDQSKQLVEQLRALSPTDISGLMGISDALGELNFERFLNWHAPFTRDNAKQALLAFRGDVYTGLDADSFGDEDFRFAQQHLRILSGLYGLLKPLDLIQPYRLEMGTRFANNRGDNLYQFWGDSLTEAANRQLKKLGSEVLLNLASNEYFKALNQSALAGDVITPVFKDLKGDKYKIVSFFAKKARGMMAAYVIKHRITDVDAIKKFRQGGYRYNAAVSTAREWVFTRDKPA